MYDLRNMMKEMSCKVDKHHQISNDKGTQADIISLLNKILEKSKECGKSIDKVFTVRDEVKTTYVQTLKDDEIKENKKLYQLD